MKQRNIGKGLVVAVIILLSLSATQSIGIPFDDDTTPPVTVHTLDPPEPDGLNGWYVSDVNITLTATDDESGVNVTYYRVDGGEWIIYNELFTLSEDGDDILIEYYSVDYAENVEDVKSFRVDIDQTVPDIDFTFEYLGNDVFIYEAEARDKMSNMERVEFYIVNQLKEVVYGSGPYYSWETTLVLELFVFGFICLRRITDENIRFYAISVRIGDNCWQDYHTIGAIAYDNAGNSNSDGMSGHPEQPKQESFRWFEFENNYSGYIGRFFICSWIVTHWDNPYSMFIDSDRFMKDL
jgi:hypothetical protein